MLIHPPWLCLATQRLALDWNQIDAFLRPRDAFPPVKPFNGRRQALKISLDFAEKA